MKSGLYNDSFFAKQSDKSYESACCVLPLVLSKIPVRSAIDVGCGVGTWASRLLESGIADVVGLDGDYVNRKMLRIPESSFQPWDLTKPIKLGRRFDLAVCMEVAEHLPESRAVSLVEDLTTLAPAVLFSAAIPGQGGTNHINEQYLSYWNKLFGERGYVLHDVIRPVLWHEERCDWVYRQNAVLFVDKQSDPLGAPVQTGVDYVHPSLHDSDMERLQVPMLGYLLRAFPGSLARSIKSRSSRLFSS